MLLKHTSHKKGLYCFTNLLSLNVALNVLMSLMKENFRLRLMMISFNLSNKLNQLFKLF